MKKISVIATIFILFFSVAFVNILSPTCESGLLLTFSDGSDQKEFVFKSGGSDNTSLSLELNKDAKVITAQMSIESSAEADTYPTNVGVDVGIDDELEWAFEGKGYGSFGHQTSFSNGQEYRNVMFKTGGYNRYTYIKLPRNATIDSASLKFKGFFGGESYIATIDYYGVIYYTECYSDGTFGTPQLVDDLTTCWHGGTGVADFDRDGDFDFIVGSGSAGYNWKNIYYYEKIGAGPTFAPKRLIGQVYGYYPMDFAVGDFDGNGNMDFMTEGLYENKARIFFGDGHGMFTFHETNDFNMYYSYGKSQGDLDEDGDVDIVIAGRPQTAGVYNIWWFENTANGQIFIPHDTGHAASSTYGIVVGDYDNDGHLDILKADNSGVWYFLKGNGLGTFNVPVATGVDVGTSYAGYGDAFNFNIENDNNLDLVCFSTYSTGELVTYLGNGDATFGSKNLLGDVGYGSYGVSAPQFNNLGHVTNPKLDIGDDNSIDWSKLGEFSTTEEKSFTNTFKELLKNPPTHISDKMVTDEYGNEFYLIPLNFTSDTPGYIGLEVDIEYRYKAIIDIKPDGNLASELNEYIENFDPNISQNLVNITIPIRVSTSTAGKLKFSDLNILYNLPPIFIKPIMTKTLEEDAVVDDLVDLSLHYYDPDEPSEDLKYTIESNSEAENIRVYTDGTYHLKVAPKKPHWYGRAEIVVRGTDMYGEYDVSNEFIIKIEPVEDNPDSNMVRPIPDITIYEGGMDNSIDLDEMDYFIDPEGDSLFFKADIDPENKYNGEQISVGINTKNVLTVRGLGDWYGNNVPVWIYCDDNSDVKTLDDGDYVHQEILVHVLPVNDPPYWDEIPEIYIDEDSYEDAYRDVLNFTHYVNDIDTPLANLGFEILYRSDENIKVTVKANNSINLKVPKNYYGSSIVGVRALDNDTFADTTFIVNINPINDAPTINIESPADQTVVEGLTSIYGTAFDLEDTIQYVRVQINEFGIWEYLSGDLNNWKFIWDTTDITPGTYQIVAEVFDGELFGKDNISLRVGFNKRPIVDIILPEDGSKVEGIVDFEGSAFDEDGIVTLVQIQIDGEGSWFECTGTDSWSYELSTLNLSNSEHTISARAFDSEQYSELDSATFNVDNRKDDDPGSDDTLPGLFSDDEGSNTMFFLLLILIIIIVIVVAALIVVTKRARVALDQELAVINKETQRIAEPEKEDTETKGINYKKYKFATPLALPAYSESEGQDSNAPETK